MSGVVGWVVLFSGVWRFAKYKSVLPKSMPVAPPRPCALECWGTGTRGRETDQLSEGSQTGNQTMDAAAPRDSVAALFHSARAAFTASRAFDGRTPAPRPRSAAAAARAAAGGAAMGWTGGDGDGGGAIGAASPARPSFLAGGHHGYAAAKAAAAEATGRVDGGGGERGGGTRRGEGGGSGRRDPAPRPSQAAASTRGPHGPPLPPPVFQFEDDDN